VQSPIDRSDCAAAGAANDASDMSNVAIANSRIRMIRSVFVVSISPSIVPAATALGGALSFAATGSRRRRAGLKWPALEP